MRDDVATWFSRTYERFYHAHREARFFEHDYKANLAFGGHISARAQAVLDAADDAEAAGIMLVFAVADSPPVITL